MDWLDLAVRRLGQHSITQRIVPAKPLAIFSLERQSSISRLAGIDIADPGQNASSEIFEIREPRFLHQSDRLGAPRPTLAVHHDRVRSIQLAEAIG